MLNPLKIRVLLGAGWLAKRQDRQKESKRSKKRKERSKRYRIAQHGEVN